MMSVSQVLAAGAAKYGEDNWRLIDVRDHVNHCLSHLFKFLQGDTTDDHLRNAACRALMALDQAIVSGGGPLVRPGGSAGSAPVARETHSPIGYRGCAFDGLDWDPERSDF
jgi:hypothetical protein